MARPILFLTDYGLADPFVGVCHAVIERLAPGVRVIDLTHAVPPGDIGAGALALADAVPYAPEDAVYLAVVDPGVGTDRRAVAVSAANAFLVGPDNGLLGMTCRSLGGARRAVRIAPGVAPWASSATFHGRDVFAPAAARLAAGAALEDLGDVIDPDGLAEWAPSQPSVEPGRVATQVIDVDRFGNLRLGVRPSHLEEADIGEGDRLALLTEGRPIELARVRTFAEIDDDGYGLLVDSSGWLAVVANRRSAAGELALARWDPVVLAAEGDAVG